MERYMLNYLVKKNAKTKPVKFLIRTIVKDIVQCITKMKTNIKASYIHKVLNILINKKYHFLII